MPDIKTAPTISIVIPFTPRSLMSSNCMPPIRRHEQLGRSYQFVFVDDGRRDLTYKLLKKLAEIDPHEVRDLRANLRVPLTSEVDS
jgi:hypothetical protein